MRALLEPERDRLVGATLKLAFDESIDGNVRVRALEVALSRLAPKPKEDAERIFIPGFADAVTLQAKAEHVLSAAANGDISVEAAEKLLRVISIYSQAVVTTDLERRVAVIEDGRSAVRDPVTVEQTIEDLI